MTIYLVIPLVFAAALLQVTFMPHLSVWGVSADLPLLLVLSWGLLRGGREGTIWGFAAGFFTDLFSGGPFGAATLSLMAAGGLSGLGKNLVFRHFILVPPLMAVLGTVVYDLSFLLILAVAGQTVVWLDTVTRVILPSAALNACLIPIILGLTRVLHRRFGQETIQI